MKRHLNRRFGNYVLVRLIARGGFARVYLARHVYLRSYVVIKVMRTYPKRLDQRLFLREAQIMASLSHSRIARILDFGIQGTTPYIVMNYFPRGSLRKRHLQGERLPLNIILRYARDLADALEYIHHKGFVHQDIKPENMLVGPNNKIVLCDFGITVTVSEAHSQGLQDIVGTVSYMAPERLEGRVYAASDQYALGIVFYEWLTGERPFRGSPEEIAWQQCYAAPPLLRRKYPEILPDVERAVLRALEKDPKDRFASVRDFVTALEQARDASLSLSKAELPAWITSEHEKRMLFFVFGTFAFSLLCFASYMLGIGINFVGVLSGLSFLTLITLYWITSRRGQ